MKFTLSEIKKNLQGTNSGVDEAVNQINDLEHKEEKTIQKKKDRLRSLWNIVNCARRRRGKARTWKLI